MSIRPSRVTQLFFVLLVMLFPLAAMGQQLTAEVHRNLLLPPNGIGTAARDLTLDAAGNVITGTDYHTIRKITPDGTFSTLAGVFGSSGYVDGPAMSAKFFQPHGLAYNAAGDLFIADRSNHAIRKLSGGTVTTLAGLGRTSGYVDGVGTAARFYAPNEMEIDDAGNLYVADGNNHAIRKIAPDGTVTTIAGNGTAGAVNGVGAAARFNSPWGIARDAAGNLFVSDGSNHAIRKIAPDGTVTTLAGTMGTSGSADGVGAAARFGAPGALALDSDGSLLVVDRQGYTIRRVAMDGTVTTVVGQLGFQGHQSGTGSAARFGSVQGFVRSGTSTLAADYFFDFGGFQGGSKEVLWKLGRSIPDVATIDAATGVIGQSRTLGSSPQTAVTWDWSLVTKPADSTLTFSSTAIDPTFTPDRKGSYKFRLRAGDATDGVSITYRDFTATCIPPPAPVITSTTANPGCPWTSFTLDAGAGYASYLWSNGATTRTITVAPGSTTTYSVTVYDATNCSSTASYTHTVTQQPQSISVTWDSGDNIVCLDNSDSSTAGRFSVFGGYTTGLQWGYRTALNGPITPIAGETGRTYVLDGQDFPGPGTYFLVATHTPGCGFTPITSTARDVQINTPITVSLTPSAPAACANGTVTLTATAAGGQGVAPFDIWWNDNGQTVWLCDDVTTCTFTGRPGHTYDVYARQYLNCGAQSNVVTVATLPVPDPVIGSRNTCLGRELYITNPQPGSTYLWTNGATGPTMIPAATGSYKVTETSSNGCSKQTQFGTWVDQVIPPPPVVTASGPTTFCEGGSVTLTAPAGSPMSGRTAPPPSRSPPRPAASTR